MVQPLADLGVHASHPSWCVQKAVTVGVFSNGSEDLPHRSLDPRLVHRACFLVGHRQ